MMYQIKRTNQKLFSRSYFKTLIIFLLIAIFVFVVSVSGLARSLISDILSPLFKTGDYFYGGLGQIPKFFSDKNELMKENENLLSEIEKLHLGAIDYESLKYENQRLREELGIKPVGNHISASIMAKPSQIPSDSLLLDKGMEGGISKGDLVLASEKILIGKIIEVSKNKATVALNSFAGTVSYGFVARTKEPLEIKGGGGSSIEAKVPIDFDIVIGDKIMVDGSFNYLIAVVGVVEEDSPSGSKNVLMSLPANVSKMNIVFIEPYIK